MRSFQSTTHPEQSERAVTRSFAHVIAQRLATADLLPEFRELVTWMARADDQWRDREWQWAWVIPAVQAALGGSDLPIEPFTDAWSLMYAAIVRLDHIQDNDPDGVSVMSQQPLPIRYNALFAYYVAAASLLDDLEPSAFPKDRIRRLHRLWSDLMLRTASGQQRDLTIGASSDQTNLTTYQELARAKTGSTFALAFGGAAALISDDPAMIAICVLIGDLFGTLVQYHDDLLDAGDQRNRALTFPNIFAQVHPNIVVNRQTVEAFWSYVYRAHRAQVEQLVLTLPEAVAARLLKLFITAFEHAPLDCTSRTV